MQGFWLMSISSLCPGWCLSSYHLKLYPHFTKFNQPTKCLTWLNAVYQVIHGSSSLPPSLGAGAAELLVTDGIRSPSTVRTLRCQVICYFHQIQRKDTWKKFRILVTSWSDLEDLFSLMSLPLETFLNSTSLGFFLVAPEDDFLMVSFPLSLSLFWLLVAPSL